MELTPQEMEFAKILSSPVSFGKYFCNWEARWYQVEMLEDPSLRKVSRCGRRIGKCLSEDSMVITEAGPVKASELAKMAHKPKILTFDEDSQKIEGTDRYLIWSNGVKPVFRIITESGRINNVTSNHPFLVKNSLGNSHWTEIKDISLGDMVAVPSTYEGLITGSKIGPVKSRLMGYLCGSKIKRSIPDKVMLGTDLDVFSFIFSYFSLAGHIFTKDGQDKIQIKFFDLENSNKLQHLLLRIGVASKIDNLSKLIVIDDKTETAIFINKLNAYRGMTSSLPDVRKDNILWDKVVSIKYIGDQHTYDLSVPETKTLIADDIVSHNTDVMSIHMLWYAYTHANSTLLVAAPYENQIDLIFSNLRDFIKRSKEISAAVVADRKHPNYIELGNGARIRGFTAGTRSGAEGGSMRGQKADWIYFDEADYLSDGDIHAITSIAIERPDIGIWASSTPTGKRGKFYSWCLEAQGGVAEVPPGVHKGEIYTVFYYPSTVLPTWNEQMEREWKLNLSEEAWEHEVMANFGRETVGVFNKLFIDRARLDYSYILEPSYHATRVIGVDKQQNGDAIWQKKYNKHYFSKIDSEEKAYWLGFIAADGWMTEEGKSSYRLGFNLQLGDEDILSSFKRSVESTHPVEYKTLKPRRKGDKQCKQAILRIGCTDMCKNLIALGIGPRKTFDLNMPPISEELMGHFIRGYFDGDGSICKRNNANSWKFTIASGSRNILDSISSFFSKNNISCSIYEDRKIFCLTITKKTSIKEARDLLYKNSTVCLERKYKVMMEVI